MALKILHTGARCPACEAEISHIQEGRVSKSEFPFTFCGHCGHIYRAVESGERRNLTAEDKKLLRSHPLAAKAKEFQELIVEKMWG